MSKTEIKYSKPTRILLVHYPGMPITKQISIVEALLGVKLK